MSNTKGYQNFMKPVDNQEPASDKPPYVLKALT